MNDEAPCCDECGVLMLRVLTVGKVTERVWRCVNCSAERPVGPRRGDSVGKERN